MNHLNELNQKKHLLDLIIEKQKASDDAKRLLIKFDEGLYNKLNSVGRYPLARTHSIGITYFCNPKKAFLFLCIRQNFLMVNFFTGKKSIEGLGKGIWINKNDNLGSTPFRITDNRTLNHALQYSLKAFDIAADW